jgi:hypothetical protein
MSENAIGRRTWIKTGALGLTSVAINQMAPLARVDISHAREAAEAAPSSFNHRGYLGWITDVATQPDPDAPWPSMRLDERLLEDYRQTFDVMSRLRMNEIVVWGFYVSRSWPVDIKSAVTPERGAMVERLIGDAHRRNLRVYSGLGVYSWGFEEIIRAYPKLSRGNPQAMCASEPESWAWMQKVIDFVFERFAIDGVSMQSADQGRCRCRQCSVYSDAEYHALLNVRVSEYIRSRWPKKTIGVNSWGMRFEEAETLPPLVKISRTVDYLIDVHDTSRRRDPGYRKRLIDTLACDFGTLGGPQVEPPQHWARERWFLPTLKRVGDHLRQLASDGGRACEYFFHILANPGDEISMWLAGRTLADPVTPWEKHLQDSIEPLYGVTRISTRDALAQLFLDAEDAYFKHLPPGFCGTLSMEPLVSASPGPPVYLRERLTAPQRAAYVQELTVLKTRAEGLLAEIPRKDKMTKIVRSIELTLADIASLAQSG